MSGAASLGPWGFGASALGDLFGEDKSTTGNTTGTSAQNGTSAQAGSNDATIDPFLTSFRNSLLPFIQGQLSKATQPIYGDAQKAQFVNQQNDLATSSFQQLNSNLAKHGALNSGAAATAGASIENSKNSGISNFMSQLPFQEAAAQSARIDPLLSLGQSFVSSAPVSHTTAENGTQNTTGNTTATSTSTDKSTPTLFGLSL